MYDGCAIAAPLAATFQNRAVPVVRIIMQLPAPAPLQKQQALVFLFYRSLLAFKSTVVEPNSGPTCLWGCYVAS